MTDKEIVKVLECCSTCKQVLIDAKDLINRLQAENEGLREDYTRVCTERDLRIVTHDFIKAEAYKEFAERLKNEIISDTAYGCDSNQHTGYYDYQIKIGDIPEYIDNLLKELVVKNDIGRYDPYTDTFVKELVGEDK